MPLPLPNLDTRRWADLVAEGRSLVPRYAPTWTDHNAHDPGVTVFELLAWLVEQEIYRANRVPAPAYRKFLALAGQAPQPPRPAHTVLALTPRPNEGTVILPAGLFFEAADGAVASRPFRSEARVAVTTALLDTLLAFDGWRFADLSRPWREGRAILPWGADPQPPRAEQPAAGPALYLGFDEPLPAGVPLSLWLEVDGPTSDRNERARLAAAAAAHAQACRPQRPQGAACANPQLLAGQADSSAAGEAGECDPGGGALSPIRHHDLTVAWEYFDGAAWQSLAADQLEDATRGLTLSGRVGLTLPATTTATVVGARPRALHYVRCRLLCGMPDAAPVLRGLWLNAAPAVQVRPIPVPVRREIAPGTQPAAAHTPIVGEMGRLQVQPAQGALTDLVFNADHAAPDTLVVDYRPATDTAPGWLTTIPITLPVARAIAPGTRPPAAQVPAPGRLGRLTAEPADAPLTQLAFVEDRITPDILVVDYQPATATTPGRLVTLAAGAAWTERGAGAPQQMVALPAAGVADGAIQVWSLAASGVERWQLLPDLDASRRTDAHVRLDAAAGTITSGDGEHGRVFASDVALLAVAEVTAGAGGADGQMGAASKQAAGSRWQLHRDFRAYHQALLDRDPAVVEAALTVTNPLPALDGADAEALEPAMGRAAALLSAHERLVALSALTGSPTLDQLDRAAVLALTAPPRAVTLLDYERLALSVPGTRVARARAWANLDPAYPGLTAASTVTVIIVPELPRGQPLPSPGLLAAVRQYLFQRRVVGTRLVVVGPDYLPVTVSASVRARRGAARAAVVAAIRTALDAFLDPLTGGPAGRGWPFGRDVYRAEILQVIDQVEGVDHVLSLELRAAAGADSCSNLCVGPTTLVIPGAHTITVEEAGIYG